MDYHGCYPASLMKDDPYFSSAFVSNLGSIKMHASYHHLANWGTNSFFMIIGEKKKRPFELEDGTVELRESIPLGLTIDERIADGLYFMNSIKLFRHLISNPELLDLPIKTEVDY
jgi:pyruvate/2-oxoglutarate dehydrogenase complex dihydrolipoamide acyltransferase (E2) component